MNIFLDNVDLNSQSGPNTFGRRLALQLQKMGHRIVSYDQPHDVHLAFIAFAHPPKIKNTILRMDGIEFKPEGFQEKNAPLKFSYKNALKVVCQSKFDKQMITKWFGDRRNISVIGNGIELKKYEPIKELKHLDEMIFCCSASWHPQKRLYDNIRLFQHIRKQLKEKGQEARLYIFGRGANLTEGSPGLENVFHLGQESQETCLRFYATADYGIHLGWLDHFPNSVVEMLSQRLPIIYSNSGGMNEVVRNNGISIDEKEEYNFELTDYDDPPSLDFNDFKLPEKIEVKDISYLDIQNVAEKYLRIF